MKAIGIEEGRVAERCGRAPHFLIGDSEVANPYASARGGAGPAVAEWLAERGVTTLVCGEFGPKMRAALDARGIEAVEFHGSIEAAQQRS